MVSGTMCKLFSRCSGVPSPPIVIIFSSDSCVRSSLSLARPSRWAIQMGCCFSAMAKCMYSLSRLLLASISRRPTLRCTMNDLFTLTRVLIQGCSSKLSPMAISTVLSKPSPMSSTSSRAESSTMSRWFEM